MKSLNRMTFFCILFITSNAFGANYFLSAADVGSWKWSGFNLHTGKLTDRDVKEMVESGAKVARFHLEATQCSSCVSYTVSEEDLQRLDRIIDSASAYGLKIIVVLDPYPKGKEADFWESPGKKNSMLNIWRNIATKYANSPTVAAFDLLNEPHPPDATSWSGGSKMWSRLAYQFAETIRREAPQHVLIVESAPIALPGAFEKMLPIPFHNVVYSFHFYEPHRLTHQGILGFPLGVAYPGNVTGKGYWNKERLSEYLEPVRKFQRQYGVPVQVGEFSFIRWGPDGSRYNYIKDLLDLIYLEKWSWLFHSYREWDGWDPEIDSNLKGVKERSSTSRDFLLIKSYMLMQ